MMLDGNAIAGLLVEVFGVELTTAATVCAGCGQHALLAERAAYTRTPGVVVRCRTCDTILIVVTERRGVHCVDLLGLAELRPA